MGSSKQKWNELALVAGAAMENGMSYGQYVARGMPNLEKFRREALSGELERKRKAAEARRAAQLAGDAGPAGEGKKRTGAGNAWTSRRMARMKKNGGVCARCGERFFPPEGAGPIPKYCEGCRKTVRSEQKKAQYARRKERRKHEKECGT